MSDAVPNSAPPAPSRRGQLKIRVGRPELAFSVLVALSYLSSAVLGPVWITGLLRLAVVALGVWVFARLSSWLVRRSLWRLRTRLLIAYLFIAVVPIVLITLLVALGAYFVAGQLAVYLVTSELDRRTAELRKTVEPLFEKPERRESWRREQSELFAKANPGATIAIRDESGDWSFPANFSVPAPPESLPEMSGLTVRKGSLYALVHLRRNGHAGTAMLPITHEYLGEILPGLGESTFVNVTARNVRRGDKGADPDLQFGGQEPGATPLVPHRNAGGQEPVDSLNRVPPQANWLDREIVWMTPVPVTMWERPAENEARPFVIRTRPSALLRLVFTQKINFANQIVPAVFLTIAILFLVAELIALIIGLSITRTITGAVHALYEGTRRVTSGDFSHRIPTRGNDQLNALANSFNQMTSHLQRLVKVEKDRERMQAELEIAREVQNQLHPKVFPELQTLAITSLCNPARMVSGDYFDYQQMAQTGVALAVGDVAGKGISAALLMATVQSCFRTLLQSSVAAAATASGATVSKPAITPSSLVSQLNLQLHACTSPEKYATFFFGMYDEANSLLTYTNAGHLPPILVRAGVASRLDVNGMVVGAFPFAQYDESKLPLAPGDLLLFFTDGITEPENAYGEMFGEDRLAQMLEKSATRQDQEIVKEIIDSVGQWTGEGELQDDMTLVLVRRR